MMKLNQPVTTYDVAALLKGEHGTFFVQRAGQDAIVVAAEGHSIKSWTPVGIVEPSGLSYGQNPPYTCTRISASENFLDAPSNEEQNRQTR